MADSMLEAIRADVGRADSVIFSDMARAMLAGATPSEAAAPGVASLSYAAVRELVPIIRRLHAQGSDRATIRATVRRAVALQADRTEGFLEAVAERALVLALGPDPAGGPATA